MSLKLENATVDITMGENMKRVDVPNKVLCELCNNVLKNGSRGCTSLDNIQMYNIKIKCIWCKVHETTFVSSF